MYFWNSSNISYFPWFAENVESRSQVIWEIIIVSFSRKRVNLVKNVRINVKFQWHWYLGTFNLVSPFRIFAIFLLFFLFISILKSIAASKLLLYSRWWIQRGRGDPQMEKIVYFTIFLILEKRKKFINSGISWEPRATARSLEFFLCVEANLNFKDSFWYF